MKNIFLLSAVIFMCITANSQSIHYRVSFPNIIHHEAEISIVAETLPMKTVVFRMSRSSPGRYATHEFGKNIYDVKAYNKMGKLLPIYRVDGDIYEVPNYTGYVKVVYTLYANYADGTYAGIDASSVHMNMPASFIWVKGADKVPIDIQFDLPEDKKWSIATQLKPTGDNNRFTAPGLQYFMDSPTKIGVLNRKNWVLKNPDGKSYQFELALEAETNDTTTAGFAKKIEIITQEAKVIFGELPAYDYGIYTFIASINPYVKGDGMEHRNSTMIAIPTKFSNSNFLLGVFAHEFFHCWNVERIRPKTIEPFNFEKSNMSDELWCAEGFTQYYGDLILTRAGLASTESFLEDISGLINTKENTQGAKRFSPVEASRHAVFVDAGVAVDKTNYSNMYTSYYPYGGAIALALDLELRTRFANLSLDSYMGAVWKKFGKTEMPYNVVGLETVLATLTSDKNFAQEFFKKYIRGHESFNYKPMLEKAGLLLKQTQSGKSWWGNTRVTEGVYLTIAANTVIGTPLYNAGLDIDDQVTTIDKQTVKKQSQVDSILKAHQPGDEIELIYIHRGETKTTRLKLSQNPALTVVLMEKEGLTVTEEMYAFRKKWLGSQIK